MKDDAYKSLCQACFEQKAQFFLGCRCIFCKNCISLWQSKAKPLENNQVDLVTCGFCGKNTDPKINNLLDMKSAQQFAFLFAEPETLFQRQIEIIQFQRGQSMKYISYLQSRVKQTDSQLSLIYTHCPEIKQKIQAIQDEQQGRYRQQPGSCINFKNESRTQKEEEMNQAQMRNNNSMEYETSPFQDNNRQVIKNQVFQQQQQQQLQLQQRVAPQNQPYPGQYQNYQPQQQQNQQPLQCQQPKLMIQQPDQSYQQQGYLQQQPQKFQPQQQQEQLSSFPAQNLASKNTSTNNNHNNQANSFQSSQLKVKSIVNLNNPNNTSKDMYLTPMITGDKRNRTATTQASSNQSGRSIQNNNINKTMNFNNNPVGVVYPIVENGSNSRGDSISSRQQQIKEHVNSAFATAYTTKPLQQSIQPSLDYSRQPRRL